MYCGFKNLFPNICCQFQNSIIIDEFKCPFCGQQFTHRKSVKRHILLHTGERPYKCMKCSAGFTESYKLKMHQKNCFPELQQSIIKTEYKHIHWNFSFKAIWFLMIWFVHFVGKSSLTEIPWNVILDCIRVRDRISVISAVLVSRNLTNSKCIWTSSAIFNSSLSAIQNHL